MKIALGFFLGLVAPVLMFEIGKVVGRFHYARARYPTFEEFSADHPYLTAALFGCVFLIWLVLWVLP